MFFKQIYNEYLKNFKKTSEEEKKKLQTEIIHTDQKLQNNNDNNEKEIEILKELKYNDFKLFLTELKLIF